MVMALFSPIGRHYDQAKRSWERIMQTTSPASLNLALSEALSRNLPDTAMKAGFNSGVLEDYRPDELAGVSVAGLVRVLGEFWSFGEAAGQAGLRIRLESPLIIARTVAFASPTLVFQELARG